MRDMQRKNRAPQEAYASILAAVLKSRGKSGRIRSREMRCLRSALRASGSSSFKQRWNGASR